MLVVSQMNTQDISCGTNGSCEGTSPDLIPGENALPFADSVTTGPSTRHMLWICTQLAQRFRCIASTVSAPMHVYGGAFGPQDLKPPLGVA
jgi:hypothetical protein